MRVPILLFVFASLTLFISSCTPEHSKIIVAEFGKYDINMGEFEKAYTKNAGGEEQAKDDSLSQLKKFLELYVNFKMKLRDADVRGFQSDPKLNAELLDYKQKVGVSYIVERELIDKAVKELYERRKYEVRVSHILIRSDGRSEEEAKLLADSLIFRIKNGEKFEDLTLKYSADNFSKEEGGDIYWLTAGQVNIPEFEDAMYNTKVGTVHPSPVKTRYGYHIIKITGRQERKPQIRARHILIDFKDDDGNIDTAAAVRKAEEIHEKLLNGGDFAELAKEYSKDKGTAEKGGDLGFFERRMMVKEFDETAFNLQPGEISDLVKTRYGFHIIQLIEVKSIPDFEEEKQNLRNQYNKTGYQRDYDNFIGDLRLKYNFRRDQDGIDFVAGKNDSVKVSGYWESKFREQVKNIPIFYIKNKPVICDSLISNIESDSKYKEKIINKSLIEESIPKYSGDLLINEKALDLDKYDTEFADLMNDYRNGIYIFKLQEDEVWNKIEVDSVKLYNYYLETNANYRWPNRVDFSEIFSRKDSLINSYYRMLEGRVDFDSLARLYTERNGYKQRAGNFGMIDVNTNEISRAANNIYAPGKFI